MGSSPMGTRTNLRGYTEYLYFGGYRNLKFRNYPNRLLKYLITSIFYHRAILSILETTVNQLVAHSVFHLVKGTP